MVISMKIDNLGSTELQGSRMEYSSKPVQGNFESKLKKAMDENDEKALKGVCSEFEGMFMKMIYKQMKNTVVKSNFMPENNAKDMFESMLDDKLAEESSRAGGIGLGEMLFKQMKKDMINKYKQI
jgi:flagellar protein FlgJ